MAYVLNSNIPALNARNATLANSNALQKSLQRLSSGLRINSASDDVAGLHIANSLRSQANSLGQAINNANDGIAVTRIADNAIDEQVKILDSIKTKAVQASQDGQSVESRKALQEDISRLMKELDNIAQTTTYNSQPLLSGAFVNKEFQVGAYSNQTVKASIQATYSNAIGHVRYETGKNITAASNVNINLYENGQSSETISLFNLKISHSPNTGLGTVVDEINKHGFPLNLKASYSVITTGETSIISGSVQDFKINGITIGNITDILAGDGDGKLVASINEVSNLTGVEGYVDFRGYLNLKSVDGRGIVVSSKAMDKDNATDLGLISAKDKDAVSVTQTGAYSVNYGRLTLTRLDARDIEIQATQTGSNNQVDANDGIGFGGEIAERTINLKGIVSTLTRDESSAIGAYNNKNVVGINTPIQAGVLSMQGALSVMDVVDAAIAHLDKVRANIGSTQRQFERVVDTISVAEINIRSAESQIRDVDFAKESSNFQKLQILTQAGNYALSQTNVTRKLVLQLLQ
jgi:flagellin